MRWRSPPPETPLAIEGNVVRYEDLPRSLRSGRPLAEPEQAAPEPLPKPPPEPEPAPPKPEVKPEPAPDKAAAEAAVARQRQQAELQATEAREAKQRAEAETQRKADAERQRKAEAEDAKRRAAAEAEQAARQQQEKAAAARVAKQKSEREAELRRQLAMEEEGEAVAQSGVIDEYRALLTQTIERNWIRPPSAKAGLKCTLFVTQATGGTVIDVKLGDCNGDQAVRESVANAVYRSSPLPAPRDPRAFERRLVIVFTPTE
jgi:colicin import membrane protein